MPNPNQATESANCENFGATLSAINNDPSLAPDACVQGPHINVRCVAESDGCDDRLLPASTNMRGVNVAVNASRAIYFTGGTYPVDWSGSQWSIIPSGYGSVLIFQAPEFIGSLWHDVIFYTNVLFNNSYIPDSSWYNVSSPGTISFNRGVVTGSRFEMISAGAVFNGDYVPNGLSFNQTLMGNTQVDTLHASSNTAGVTLVLQGTVGDIQVSGDFDNTYMAISAPQSGTIEIVNATFAYPPVPGNGATLPAITINGGFSPGYGDCQAVHLDALIYRNVTSSVQALQSVGYFGCPLTGNIGRVAFEDSSLGDILLMGFNVADLAVTGSTVHFNGYGGTTLSTSRLTVTDSSIHCDFGGLISLPGLNALTINGTAVNGCAIETSQAETVTINSSNLRESSFTQTPVDDGFVSSTSSFILANSTVQGLAANQVFAGISTHSLQITNVIVNPDESAPYAPPYTLTFMNNVTVTGPTVISGVTFNGVELQHLDLQGNTVVSDVLINTPFTAIDADPFCGSSDTTPCQPRGVTIIGNGEVSVTCDGVQPAPHLQRAVEAHTVTSRVGSTYASFFRGVRNATGAGISALAAGGGILAPCHPGPSDQGSSHHVEINMVYVAIGIATSLSLLLAIAYVAYTRLWRQAPATLDLEMADPQHLALDNQQHPELENENQPLLGGEGPHANMYPVIHPGEFDANCAQAQTSNHTSRPEDELDTTCLGLF